MAKVKDTIDIDVLDKIDIRVGTIELVEDVEGSDKLVNLLLILKILRGQFYVE